ncbi:MAG: carboxylate-amine ligase [Verrucomicrobiaceae bacterium]
MSFHLLQYLGIEIEYMIVDRDTLQILPIAHTVLLDLDADDNGDLVRGEFTWSNELTNHVLELKTSDPEPSLEGVHRRMEDEVRWMNGQLALSNARLLPTSMHPWMDPKKETVLWPLGHREIYRKYDEIFYCHSHGWANVQSTHLNISFIGDEEFAKLHAAIRIILPLLPAICASSPIIEGDPGDDLDCRLDFYWNNQRSIPAITGEIIPEIVHSQADYERLIYEPIRSSMALHDPEGLLEVDFLNSRGAIARFDRGSIEIRVMDSQECPRADLGISEFVVGLLKWLVARTPDHPLQAETSTIALAQLYRAAIHEGLNAPIMHESLLPLWGMKPGAHFTIGDIIAHLSRELEGSISRNAVEVINDILENGNLAQRILRDLAANGDDLHLTYSRLADCLIHNRIFTPGT